MKNRRRGHWRIVILLVMTVWLAGCQSLSLGEKRLVQLDDAPWKGSSTIEKIAEDNRLSKGGIRHDRLKNKEPLDTTYSHEKGSFSWLQKL